MKKMTDKITYKIIHADDKIINTMTIIVDILMIVIFALTLILKTNFMYGLYWIFIILFLTVDLISIMHWDVDGLRTEKRESDKIIRGFRDATAMTVILSAFGFIAVIFLETIKKDITKNTYVIIGLFCLLAITQLFNRLMIHANIKETAKFTKEFYKKNNKEK
ncbi:MAG: hypothetical protein J6B98_04090 [Bacilli bacterium]|nr:hypothetical protein [Bacilli bacterium]